MKQQSGETDVEGDKSINSATTTKERNTCR